MSKRNTNDTYSDVKKSQAANDTNYAGAQAANTANTTALTGERNQSRSDLSGAVAGLAPRGTLSAGQVSTSGFDPISKGYMDMAANGGYSPDREASIMGNVAGLKQLGATGGIDDASANRFRGNGTFDEFAKTGGLSDVDKANIQAKALSPISAYAKSTNDELSRRRAVQGGYAPGFDASSRALRQDTARNIAGTSLDAQLGIMGQVNAGRQWGATGMSNAENSLQTLKTGNEYRGLTGAADVETNLQNSINQYKMAGLSGAQAVAQAVADIQTGNRNATMNADQYNIGNAESIDAAKVAGLGSIYSGSDADLNASQDRGNSILGARASTDLGYYSPRTGLATQPGVGGNIIRGLGAGAGAIAGVM